MMEVGIPVCIVIDEELVVTSAAKSDVERSIRALVGRVKQRVIQEIMDSSAAVLGAPTPSISASPVKAIKI